MADTVEKSWTSATDPTCKALATGSCRCKSGIAVTGDRVTSKKTCKTEFPGCFTTMTLKTDHCRRTMASTEAYTSATDATCVAMKTTECRDTDYTKCVGTRKSGATTCAAACPAPAAAGGAAAAAAAAGEGEGAAAGEGEGEGAGEGAASAAGEAKSSSVI